MPRELQFFSEAFQQLNQELSSGLHEGLEEILKEEDSNAMEIRLAKIAHYCGILLDGTYSSADIDKLCTILANKLVSMRTRPSSSILLLS